jgi:DNA-binding beta-propeller fold protein YncE
MTTDVRIQRFPLPTAAQAAKYTDTLDIDQAAHRLYLGDNWSGGVDVFDISMPQPVYLKTIRMRGNLFGVAVAKDVQKLFVGLANSIVAVVDIDPTSAAADTVIDRVDTEGRGACDLLDYDPVHGKLYVANRHTVDGVDNGFLTAIDGRTHAIVGRIDNLGRTLEQPRFNPADGMVYVTGAGDNVLHQIDPVTDTLVRTFEIEDDCHPNGLAINPNTNQALLACNNRERPHTVIWDLTTQTIASVIEESGAGDGAIYDETADRFFFAASGFSRGPVMGVYGGNPVRFVTNIETERGSSWVAYDHTNRLVYAPAYEDGKPALISFPLPEA